MVNRIKEEKICPCPTFVSEYIFSRTRSSEFKLSVQEFECRGTSAFWRPISAYFVWGLWCWSCESQFLNSFFQFLRTVWRHAMWNMTNLSAMWKVTLFFVPHRALYDVSFWVGLSGLVLTPQPFDLPLRAVCWKEETNWGASWANVRIRDSSDELWIVANNRDAFRLVDT